MCRLALVVGTCSVSLVKPKGPAPGIEDQLSKLSILNYLEYSFSPYWRASGVLLLLSQLTSVGGGDKSVTKP